jgi:hypothetical protein
MLVENGFKIKGLEEILISLGISELNPSEDTQNLFIIFQCLKVVALSIDSIGLLLLLVEVIE